MTRDKKNFEEGNSGNLEYKGEPLYHGAPHELIGDTVKVGSDGRTWTANHPAEAARYATYKHDKTPVHVYEVSPIDPNQLVGVPGPRMYNGKLVTHYYSGAGFKIVRKLDSEEFQ